MKQNKEYLKIFPKIIYLLIGLMPLSVVSYAFGHRLLFGMTSGNDFPHALNYSTWLNRFFPGTPFWFPDGGGQSFIQNSQLGAFYFPVILNRILGLDIVQAFRLMAFLVVPLVALGIYLFVWYKLKNQTAALLAGLFYTLSQSTWTWLYDTGLYSQSVSLIFIIPTIFVFDRYLSVQGRQKGIWFGLTCLILALLAFTHLASGFVLFEMLVIYSLLWTFLERREKVGFVSLVQSIGKPLLVIGFSILLISFWFFPYLRYFSLTNGGNLFSPDLSPFPHFRLGGFFGVLGPLQTFGTEADTGWYMFFAAPVSLWALVGIILGFIRKKGLILGWGFLAIFFVLQTSLPTYWENPPMFIARYWRVVTIRSIVPALFFLPMVAAYGADEFIQVLLGPVRKLKIVFNSLRLPLVMFVVALSIVYLRYTPTDLGNYLGYGPSFSHRITYQQGKLEMKDGEIWTPWQLSKETGFAYDGRVVDINRKLGLKTSDKVDISYSWAGLIEDWRMLSETPISTTYNIAGLPNQFLWNYQQQTFYNPKTATTSREVNQLAKYFGINYALIFEGENPPERFDQDWEETEATGIEYLKAFHYQKATAQTEITNKPLILVIGSHERNAYETIFRLANLGILDYEDAILAAGEDKIDIYQKADLKKYSAVILYGYSYSNRQVAWQRLTDYVKEGGRLFIETGWQYVNPDWQMASAPEVIPVKSTSWKQFTSWNIEGFAPPSFNGEPWGASAGQELKPWAKPVIQIDGDTLVAVGNFGKGKIVWSGLNLPAHAYFHKSEAEYKLIKDLITSLLSLGGEVKTDLAVTRDYPDQIKFNFPKTASSSKLYFKENYFPDWQAKVKTEKGWLETEILRVGAGHMLVQLPVGSTELKLEYQASSTVVISRVISAVSFLVLLLVIIMYKHFVGKGVIGKIGTSGVKRWWEKEDED